VAAIRKYDSDTFVGVLSVTELKLSHTKIYLVNVFVSAPECRDIVLEA